MNPAVSIVVPAFNRLDFLMPALESVFAQTCGDWELLVVDDGSGPQAQSYLASLAQRPQVEVLWHAHCANPAMVRNAALARARGEFIAFLDSDDLWLPQKLARQLASLRSHPARRWGCTAFVLIDADGQPTQARRVWPAPQGWAQAQLLSGEKCIHISSVVVAAQLLREVGGFDIDTRWCTDLDLWFRLAARSEVDGLDEPLTLGRRHSQHSCDDVAALEDLGYVMAKTVRGEPDPALRRVAQRRRALAAAQLACSHGTGRATARVVRTLLSSAGYSWRYVAWWRAAAEGLARSTCPRTAAALWRGWRRARAVVAHAGR